MAHTSTKEYLTQEKYDELTQELTFLKTTRRKEIADQLEYAKSLGDLSENAEYHAAREAQGALEDRITQLTALLKTAEIVKPHKSTTVEVGSTVVVKKEKEKETRTFSMVGSEEADMTAGKISHHSPLGQAMLGKKKGETFTVTTPAGKKITYTIVKIQ